MRNPFDTPALIVGGSIVGLSAAAFLAYHGIKPVLVEQRADLSRRLRAKVFYPRTMELYRSIGLEQRILDAEPQGAARPTDVAIVECLSGPEIKRWSVPAAHETADASPTRSVFIKQRNLEQIVRERAQELGADLRFSTELLSFAQDDEGVAAQIRDRVTGETRELRSRYLIGADGNASLVRDRLGIGRRGIGTLSHEMDINFEMDLRSLIAGRPLAFVYVRAADLSAYLSWEASMDRGTVSVNCDPAAENPAQPFDEDRCRAIVSRALGLPESAFRITGWHGWEMASWTAERYGAGRVFLAGDAVHVTPPVGGFGANTGIHDAHNLSLKLVQVISGEASPLLLSSYQQERQPVGQLSVEQATARLADRPNMAAKLADHRPILDEEAVMLGYRYRSDAITTAEDEGPEACPPSALRAQCGTRAPHLWLRCDGKRMSTLDLYGRHLVLIAGPAAARWCAAARDIASATGMPIEVSQLGSDIFDESGGFLTAHDMRAEDAILVRTDGFVAWRSPSSPAPSALFAAMERALGRSSAELVFDRYSEVVA